MTPRPPKLVEWLMHLSIGPADRQAVLGDLHEEHRVRVERDGPRAARRWCWRQLRISFVSNLRRRLEQSREAWPTGAADGSRRRLGLEGMGQDLRHAVRSLRATPTFTVVALAVLSLGIGATTAIFSVVDAVALRGVPFARGNRLVLVTEPRQSGRGGTTVSPPDFDEWRREQTAFEDLAASQGSSDFVMRDNAASETLRASLVSVGLFHVLRASPAIGRTFAAQDEIPGNERVVILSDACWRRRFGADPGVVGRTIAFESGDWVVVGVMPSSFVYPVNATRQTDLWAPWAPDSKSLQRGRSQPYNLTVVGRLKDDASIAQAQADLDGIMTRVKAQYASSVGDRVAHVAFLQDAIVGSAKSWMLMLLGSVTFVLLIACVNVANLMLARASARSRDVAVRSALGASRWRIIRGLLAESLVLAVAGTVLGVGLAIWCVELLRASLPANLPRIDQIGINYRVLVAAAIAALAVTIGITPVWQSSSQTLGASLRESGRSGNAGASRQRVRTTLLVAEVALAVILLVGSGLFISSFVRLMSVDLGFDLDNVLSVDVVSRRMTDADMPRTSAAVTAVVDQVRRVPGLEAVALAWGTQPLVNGNDRTSVAVPGQPASNQPDDQADEKYITSDYFKVLRVPVIRGRAFTDLDMAPGAPQAVILNDVAVARYFGGTDPLGITIAADGDRVVVGVVRSVRLQGPEGDLRPEIYVPLNWQHAYGSPLVTLMMRTTRDPASFIPTIRAAIRSAAPTLTVPDPQTYGDRFSRIVAQRKFNMIVLALFGLLAIAIAAAGIYGVMAYLVEQRTQEIGVRMALGAEPAGVARMVLARATVYMTLGLAIGLSGGWLLSRFVQAFLFKLDAHEPIVYLAVAALLVATGLLASLIPARRAARVDPVTALRS